LHDGRAKVICTIAHEVLRDLAHGHQLSGPDEVLFSLLLPEIEELADTKFHAGKIDENGVLTIGTSDLIRYGRTVLRAESPYG
jgi:hypothetical protein